MIIEAYVQELATRYYAVWRTVAIFWQDPILSE